MIAGRVSSKQLPGPPNVTVLRSKVPEGQPDHEPAVQPRVRHEDLAGSVDRVEHRLVPGVEERLHLGLTLAPGELGAFIERSPVKVEIRMSSIR